MRRIYRPGTTFALVILICVSWFAYPDTAIADPFHTSDQSNTLTIKVGYYGGPYYEKKVYSLADLEAMSQYQQAYTYIDAMPAVVIDSAVGVKLIDIMENAGVDVNSIQGFNFYCTDVTVGYYKSITKPFLLDTARYYYPNLPSHWDNETLSSIPGAVYGAERVETMLTLSDNWKRFAVAPDFSVLDTSTRFRLMLGQTDASTSNADMSAKWVHAIEVTLGGTPPSGITVDQPLEDIEVGSTLQLTATILPPDESTDRRVLWSSNNSKAVTVNRYGMIRVVGEGTAVITATTVVGGLSAQVVINGPIPETPTPDAPSTTVGPIVLSNNQGGSSSQGGSSNRRGPNAPPEAAANNESKLIEKNKATTVSPQPVAEKSGSQPWRVFEMSANAVPLEQKNQEDVDIFAAISCALLFISGSSKKYVEHTKETTN